MYISRINNTREPSPQSTVTKELTVALLFLLLLLATVLLPAPVLAQTSQRWFQIELSIFSNESFADRDEELWQAGRSELSYPSPVRRLGALSDLLLTDQMIADAIGADAEQNSLRVDEAPPIDLDEEAQAAADRAERLAAVLATGPGPARAEGDFRLYDLERPLYTTRAPAERFSADQSSTGTLIRAPIVVSWTVARITFGCERGDATLCAGRSALWRST